MWHSMYCIHFRDVVEPYLAQGSDYVRVTDRFWLGAGGMLTHTTYTRPCLKSTVNMFFIQMACVCIGVCNIGLM